MLPWVSSLLGFSIASLVQDFARTPPSRFAFQATDLATRCPRHRRPGVSIGLRPAPSTSPQQAATVGKDDPSRVCAPARSRTFGRRPPRAMRSPLIVSCITADQPMGFGGYLFALPELPGSAEVPSICDLNVGDARSDARGALQSIRFGCSTVSVTTAGRPLVGLAARSEFLTRRRIALIG
jgi:hypothetical protein